MRFRLILGSIAILLLAALAARTQTTAGTSTAIPHLQKQGTAAQMIVDGKPFLMLAGELRNSSSSTLNYMNRGAAAGKAEYPLGNYVMDVRHPPPAPGQPAKRSGVLFISLGPDEYLIAGSGTATIGFAPNTPGDPTAGILSLEEGAYVNGRWVPGRRLNGDENGSGKNVRIGGRNGMIQRVKLYRYR